jgi:hypothetical protein
MRLDKGDEVASLAIFAKEDEEVGPSPRKDIEDKEKTSKAKQKDVKPKAKKAKKKTTRSPRTRPTKFKRAARKRKETLNSFPLNN